MHMNCILKQLIEKGKYVKSVVLNIQFLDIYYFVINNLIVYGFMNDLFIKII